MNLKSTRGTTNQGQGFDTPEDVLESLHTIRNAIVDVLESAGLDATKGRETARELGLDRNLMWKVGRFVGAEDLFSVTHEIPTSSQFQKICRACQDRGASEEVLEAAQDVVSAFEVGAKESAGSAEYFTAMLSGLTQEGKRQEEARRRSFLGNLGIWGVQASVNFKAMICVPSASDPNTMDIVQLGGLVDFKRARPIRWPIRRSGASNDDGSVRPVLSVPLDPGVDPESGLPLLPEFCSKPVPMIHAVRSGGVTRFDVAARGFGKSGATTCVFGEVFRGRQNRFRDNGGEIYLDSSLELVTPAEFAFTDFIVHEKLGFTGSPEVMLVDRLAVPRGETPAAHEPLVLPFADPLVTLRPGIGAAAIRSYPEYTELLRFAFEQVGWDPAQFVGHRFAQAFPPVPSAAVLRRVLPSRPNS